MSTPTPPDRPVSERRVAASEEAMIAALVRSGALIPVQVFGSCDHPVTNDRGQTFRCEEPDHWGFGLSDRMSEHAMVGSDCNRAEGFILRPSDALMGTAAVREAIAAVVAAADRFYDKLTAR